MKQRYLVFLPRRFNFFWRQIFVQTFADELEQFARMIGFLQKVVSGFHQMFVFAFFSHAITTGVNDLERRFIGAQSFRQFMSVNPVRHDHVRQQ